MTIARRPVDWPGRRAAFSPERPGGRHADARCDHPLAITVVAVSMSVFHLYVAFVGPPDAYVMRGLHLAFALVLAFLILPGGRPRPTRGHLRRRAAARGRRGCALYPMWNLHYIQTRMYYVDDPLFWDYVFGITLIVLIMEATRRATGWALPITAALFLLYGLTWGNQSVGIMLDQLYLTTEGIFGIPLYVSATYVMLFILFGAFVERSGAGSCSWTSRSRWPATPRAGRPRWRSSRPRCSARSRAAPSPT
jgi:TRAP-type uncharacterized transport system fused permease subunit